MKKIKLIINIILPSIVCVIGLNFIFGELYFYPLLFGVVLGLFNWKLHKKKPITGVLLSIIVSYATFCLAYFGWGGINKLIGLVFENMGHRFYGKESIALKTFVMSFFLIAPLLVFYAFGFVFNITKTKLTKSIVVLSIIILLSYSVFDLYLTSTNNILPKSFSVFLWQFIMALGLQLILYQQELKKVFYKDK